MRIGRDRGIRRLIAAHRGIDPWTDDLMGRAVDTALPRRAICSVAVLPPAEGGVSASNFPARTEWLGASVGGAFYDAHAIWRIAIRNFRNNAIT
jgi:hypothetical protein